MWNIVSARGRPVLTAGKVATVGDVDHPLLTLLTDAARGEFPPVDGSVTFLPELGDGNRAIVACTGHAVVASP